MKMSTTVEMNNNYDDNDLRSRRNSLEERRSINSSMKRSSLEEHISPIMDDDEEYETLQELKRIIKPNPRSQIPKLKYSKQLSSSMIIRNDKSSSFKWNSTSNTPRQLPAVVPSVGRHPVQGALVRFFRNGEVHHSGFKVAINELEIKSWEAFLNFLNRQPKLRLSTGGIKHVYSLHGQEIRSTNKFQNRQSYVVASGIFIKTNYNHVYDSFIEDPDTNPNQQDPSSNGNARSSVYTQWRLPPTNGEQIFFLPYSRLNMYESMILNRNLSTTNTFEQWLNSQVTDLLAQFIGENGITHLYAITKSDFTEVKSFSQLFNILKVTDTFIGCTEEEFEHSKGYLATMKPNDIFLNKIWLKKSTNVTQRYILKQIVEDKNVSISWVHGYDGTNERTKNLYTLAENEIMYVIDSVCILYLPSLQQQRFYTKHKNSITCVNVHRYQSLVASSEVTPSKDRPRVVLHIWDYIKLETVAELRKEQFGSDLSLLSFSPKPDDNLLLIVSSEKPKILLFFDWKRNEVIYSITCKSDKILSALFVFNTTEWIVCISQQHLLFYNINWNSKPLPILEQRESDVQNIYTGAVACDNSGEWLIIGDKTGSIYIWRLIDNEPKLMVVKENILQSDVQIIEAINQEIFLFANKQNEMKIWNVKLNTMESIRLKETFGSIQSICCLRQGLNTMELIIGTKLNCIVSKKLNNEQFDVIMRGHTNSSICICCNKNTDYFFSISSDRYLFKWNNRTKSVEWSTKAPQIISCAALHPERNIIVLGTETSKLIIYDTFSSYYISTVILKVNTGVKSIRFSPDGGDLAVGLQNGTVCVFEVIGNGDFYLRTDGASQDNNASVTDIIWSVDSSHLLAVYSDNNYNIWSIPSFDTVKGKNIQNIQWHQVVHPVTCTILDKSIIETHSSAIVLSANLVLCCGKDGQIRLFRNNNERNFQILPFGFNSIQSIIPSTGNNTFFLSITNNPVIVEVEVNTELL